MNVLRFTEHTCIAFVLFGDLTSWFAQGFVHTRLVKDITRLLNSVRSL